MTTWVHPRIAGSANEITTLQVPTGWLRLVETDGHGPLSWADHLRARLPAQREATELQIPSVLPVLEIVRVGRSALDGLPIEVTTHVIPSDRVEVVNGVYTGQNDDEGPG
jgi:GntR family transcriptional regulator